MAPESQCAHVSRLRRLLLLLLYSEQRMVLLTHRAQLEQPPSLQYSHKALGAKRSRHPLSEHTSRKHHPHCTCQEQGTLHPLEFSRQSTVWSRQIRGQDKPQGEGQEESKLTVHVEVWSLQGRCPGNLRKEVHAQASPMHVCTL